MLAPVSTSSCRKRPTRPWAARSPRLTGGRPDAMAAGAGKVALANTTASLGCNGGAGQPCAPAAGPDHRLRRLRQRQLLRRCRAVRPHQHDPALRGAAGLHGDRQRLDGLRRRAADASQHGDAAESVHWDTDADALGQQRERQRATPARRRSTSPSHSQSRPAPAAAFDIATADGGATAVSNDYVAQSLTGQTIVGRVVEYVLVVVDGDVGAEPYETFFVNVTNVVGATVADGKAKEPSSTTTWRWSRSTTSRAQPRSPRLGQRLRTTPAVVTAMRRGNGNGFYIQDLSPDASDATSADHRLHQLGPDGGRGQLVQVTGTVTEFGWRRTSPSPSSARPSSTCSVGQRLAVSPWSSEPGSGATD